VRFGAGGEPLLYGHPLLERFVRFTTDRVPVAYGALEVEYLKQGGFERLLERDLSLWNVGTRIVTHAAARNSYLVLACHYVALSDERKEGLVTVAVEERRGALVPEFLDRWREFHPRFYSAEEVPPHFPGEIGPAVAAGLARARDAAAQELAPFRASMARHLARDVSHTREYYGALEREMRAQAAKPALREALRQSRREKLAELPGELARKIGDLHHKYRIEVRLRACGALRLLVPVVQLSVEVRYRKFRRDLPLTYDPVIQRMDPLVCECCRQTARQLYPAGAKRGFRLCCAPCSESRRGKREEAR
jgi:hypothetical protein